MPAKEKKEVYDLMKEMGIKIGHKLEFLPDKVGSEVRITDGDVIHFPVILLYDEFMQSDVISDFPTNSTFRT